jgi:hypothetical protein
MFKDDAYFYVSECDLEKLSEKYPGKPLAFAYYRFLVDSGYLKTEFTVSRCANFYIKVYEKTGILEIKFPDDSELFIGDGSVNVRCKKMGYSASFAHI